jgi:hypothetical protein
MRIWFYFRTRLVPWHRTNTSSMMSFPLPTVLFLDIFHWIIIFLLHYKICSIWVGNVCSVKKTCYLWLQCTLLTINEQTVKMYQLNRNTCTIKYYIFFGLILYWNYRCFIANSINMYTLFLRQYTKSTGLYISCEFILILHAMCYGYWLNLFVFFLGHQGKMIINDVVNKHLFWKWTTQDYFFLDQIWFHSIQCF